MTNQERKLKSITKMYRISVKDNEFYVNGEKVIDELKYKIKVRLAIADFRRDIQENKLQIRSRIYTI